MFENLKSSFFSGMQLFNCLTNALRSVIMLLKSAPEELDLTGMRLVN